MSDPAINDQALVNRMVAGFIFIVTAIGAWVARTTWKNDKAISLLQQKQKQMEAHVSEISGRAHVTHEGVRKAIKEELDERERNQELLRVERERRLIAEIKQTMSEQSMMTLAHIDKHITNRYTSLPEQRRDEPD